MGFSFSNLYPVLLVLLICSCSTAQPGKGNINSGQKNLSSNRKNIEFYDEYHYALLSHDSCSSFKSLQVWQFKNGYATVKFFDPIDSISHQSIPFKFVICENKIFLKYVSNNNIDSTVFLNLNYNDTIDSFQDFRKFISKTETAKDISSIYKGDTVLVIKGKRYECYEFELFKNWIKSFPGPSHYKETIFLDKKTLIPIQENYFSYFLRHFCIPDKQWVLVREIKML